MMRKRSLLAAVMLSLGLSASAEAQQYFVNYSFSSGLGATSFINANDPLVARAYPSVSSNPVLTVAGGQLSLGTQATSQTFNNGQSKIAGVRPLFGGFNDPSRTLYQSAMAAVH